QRRRGAALSPGSEGYDAVGSGRLRRSLSVLLPHEGAVAAGLRHRAGRVSGAGARVRVARELSRAGVLAAGATGLGWSTERSTVHRALFLRAGGAAVALRATDAAPVA